MRKYSSYKAPCLTIFLILFLFAFQNTRAQSGAIKIADSLFLAKDWKKAKQTYEAELKDTTHNSLAWNRLGFSNYMLKQYGVALKNFERSLSQNPPPGLKPIVYSRMARIHALKNENIRAYTDIDSAVSNGYLNFKELDTLADFNKLREEKRFKDIRQHIYTTVYPCMGDAHAREFDFWIGEWDVYPTGTNTIAGHSLIQMISGGCALLENWDSPTSTGKSINFVDPLTHKWKQTWVGSYTAGTQEFVDGEYKDSAMRFSFETTNPQGGKLMGRFIFYNQGPNQVRQFNEISADGGKTWTTAYDFTYIRKK